MIDAIEYCSRFSFVTDKKRLKGSKEIQHFSFTLFLQLRKIFEKESYLQQKFSFFKEAKFNSSVEGMPRKECKLNKEKRGTTNI